MSLSINSKRPKVYEEKEGKFQSSQDFNNQLHNNSPDQMEYQKLLVSQIKCQEMKNKYLFKEAEDTQDIFDPDTFVLL